MPTAPQKLSPSVQGALNRLVKKGAVTAVDFAGAILASHREYGDHKGALFATMLLGDVKILDYANASASNSSDGPSNSKRMRPQQWVDEVGALFSAEKNPELHGRLMLIGLATLDEPLREILEHEDFLSALINELRERWVDLLSPEGRDLYHRTIGKRKDEVSDYVGNRGDDPIQYENDDTLDRYAFAEFLVKLINNTDLSHGSYSLHLYAPWGAGKTSMLNFMKQIFMNGNLDAESKNEGEARAKNPKWQVVDFNAWQNQNLAYPWWTLMEAVYSRIKKKMPFSKRLKEWWWRFKTSRFHYLFALAVIAWLMVFLMPFLKTKTGEDPIDGFEKVFDNIDKIIAGILSLWALVIGISKSIFLGPQKEAENYISSQKDPMAGFKHRFRNLVSSVPSTKIAIIVDDLDRCKSSFVVELLENIQTLLKDANVLFIVAADKDWIHASYEIEYEKMKGYLNVEGKDIGPLFTEKMFQLSVALPGVPASVKENLWYSMLGVEVGKTEEPAGETIRANSVQQREKAVAAASKGSPVQNRAIRLDLLKTLADKKVLSQTEHFLKPYSVLLDLNPRSMKRLLNSYSVNMASSLISQIDIPALQMIRWTILQMRWPMLAEQLLLDPGLLSGTSTTGSSVPANIASLLGNSEVKMVLTSPTPGEPLKIETLVKCEQLFL